MSNPLRKPWVQTSIALSYILWQTLRYVHTHTDLWELLVSYMILGALLVRGFEYLKARGILHWPRDDEYLERG